MVSNFSHAENCTNDAQALLGINVTIPKTAAPDSILKYVGCAKGYTQLSSSVDVHCQLNGSWATFPSCES